MWAGKADVLLQFLRTPEGASALLPGDHPLRGRRPDRHHPLLRHAGRGQARADLRGLGAARHLRCRSPQRSSRSLPCSHGAAIYIPTFLWSLGVMKVDPEVYRMVWWALGHSSQQINVAAMVSVWYLLGGADRRRRGAEREDQPHRVRALHPLHLHGVGPPPVGRPGLRPRLESGQHKLFHVHGGARQHDPRLHRAGRDRTGPAAARVRPGTLRLAPPRALGRSRLQRHDLFDHCLRVRRGNHRSHLRDGADQYHRAQHAQRSRGTSTPQSSAGPRWPSWA